MSNVIYPKETLADIADAAAHPAQWMRVGEWDSLSVTLSWLTGTPTGGFLKFQVSDLPDPGAADGVDLAAPAPIAIPATAGGQIPLAVPYGSLVSEWIRPVVTLAAGAMSGISLNYTVKMCE